VSTNPLNLNNVGYDLGGALSKKRDTIRVNEQIRARELRVIKSNGDQAGILTLEEALDLAAEEGADLVEISPNADPPVCKVMDYGKFKFQQAKKTKDAKLKQKQVQVKEVKFKPRIDEHDFQFKCKHIRRFLDHGDKVRAFVHFRGRELTHREIGMRLLERIIEDLKDLVIVEKRPGMEGNQMAMYLITADTGKLKKPVRPDAAEGTEDHEAEDHEAEDLALAAMDANDDDDDDDDIDGEEETSEEDEDSEEEDEAS